MFDTPLYTPWIQRLQAVHVGTLRKKWRLNFQEKSQILGEGGSWRNRFWLGCQDSNLGMAESKSAALPLGYTPAVFGGDRVIRVFRMGFKGERVLSRR